jgi:transposase
MGYIRGHSRDQVTLFPESVDDYIPADHLVRVIDAFIEGQDLAALKFQRSIAADTGRPGYNPADLLKLYVYGRLKPGGRLWMK